MSTLVQLWEEAERARPEKIVLISSGQRLTYREVGERIRKLRAAFELRWHLQPGDIVALLLPNSIEFVVSYFAIVMAGGIVQPLDERLSSPEFRSLLLDSRARFLIVHRSLWPKLKEASGSLQHIEGILGIGITHEEAARYDEWLASDVVAPHDSPVNSDTIAELMYTSGTTGEPKAAMRSHRNVRAASRNARKGFGYSSQDIIAIVMPLSHSSALVSQMMPLVELSGTLVILSKFDAPTLLTTIKNERVTCMRAVPAMIKLLLALPDFCMEQLPSLRMVINSSAAIDPDLYVALKQRFRNVQIMNSYGLTEASTCTILPDADALARADSIGIPIDGVDMCVMDHQGNSLQHNEIGEICVRGEHVFSGYRGKPQETEATFVRGWLRTGDLGYRDADGYFYLQGRQSEMINCGGRKVIPQEVEACIRQIVEVADVVVVSMAHRVLGHVVKALVVLRTPNSLDAKVIIRHCSRSLANYKVPFSVEFVSEVPRNSLGKVLRREVPAPPSPILIAS
jgi:long-chain acyl-CoA synthetase